MYNSPPELQLPNTLPLASGDQHQSLEQSHDSREQYGLEDTNTLSLGLYKVNGPSYHQHSTLLESFGYSEDSNSNTIALLKMVSATMIFSIGLVFWSLTQVSSGIQTV